MREIIINENLLGKLRLMENNLSIWIKPTLNSLSNFPARASKRVVFPEEGGPNKSVILCKNNKRGHIHRHYEDYRVTYFLVFEFVLKLLYNL